MLLLWAGILIAAVWGLSLLFPRRNPTKREKLSALEILDARYARGEVSDTEYERVRARLQE